MSDGVNKHEDFTSIKAREMLKSLPLSILHWNDYSNNLSIFQRYIYREVKQ